MEDDLSSKMTFNGRWPLTEEGFCLRMILLFCIYMRRPKNDLNEEFCHDRDHYLIGTGKVLNLQTKTKSIHEHLSSKSPLILFETKINTIPDLKILPKLGPIPGPDRWSVELQDQKSSWIPNTSIAAPGHSLTSYNTALPAKSNMAARVPQNGRLGLERCLPLDFWALLSTFSR